MDRVPGSGFEGTTCPRFKTPPRGMVSRCFRARLFLVQASSWPSGLVPASAGKLTCTKSDDTRNFSRLPFAQDVPISVYCIWDRYKLPRRTRHLRDKYCLAFNRRTSCMRIEHVINRITLPSQISDLYGTKSLTRGSHYSCRVSPLLLRVSVDLHADVTSLRNAPVSQWMTCTLARPHSPFNVFDNVQPTHLSPQHWPKPRMYLRTAG